MWQERRGKISQTKSQGKSAIYHYISSYSKHCRMLFSFQKRLDRQQKNTQKSPLPFSPSGENSPPNPQISHKSQYHLQSFLYSAFEHGRAAPRTFPHQQMVGESNLGGWAPQHTGNLRQNSDNAKVHWLDSTFTTSFPTKNGYGAKTNKK